MTKVFELFEKYILEKLPQITFVSLTVVFFINAFYNIGLLNDGTLNLANILCDIFWDENRLFATFIVNLPMILSIKLGSTDINLFVMLQGFWFFFVTLICLFIAYINIPKEHKDKFQFVLLSYLICMNFVGTFFSNKSFICAGLYWIIVVLLIFTKLHTISYKKLFLLLISSVLMIKNYEWNVIFMTLLSIYFMFKLKNTDRHINPYRKVLLYTVLFVFLLTIFSFVMLYSHNKEFFFFIARNPIKEIISDFQLPQALIAILFIGVIIIFSFKKYNNKLTKPILLSCFFSLTVIFVNYNFLYSIASFRLFNFFMPLIFSFIIFFIYTKNIFVNFKFIKILNFLLLIFFTINIFIITKKWNESLDNIFFILSKHNGILKAENYPLSLQEGFHLHSWLSIIIQKERGISNINSIFIYFDRMQPLNPTPMEYIVLQKTNLDFVCNVKSIPNLKKFGITYSDDLLKKIEENSKLILKID